MRTLREQKTCLMHVYPVRPMAPTPLDVLNATNGLAVFPESKNTSDESQTSSNSPSFLPLPVRGNENNSSSSILIGVKSYRIDGLFGYTGNFRRLSSRESRSIVIVARNSRPIVMTG